MKREAFVQLARCPSNGKHYGIRMEKTAEGRWRKTWAFPMKEESARREHYGETDITGLFGGWTEEYPGCPYCEKKQTVYCGGCKLGVCVEQNAPSYTCACGHFETLIWGDFEVTFSTGADR